MTFLGFILSFVSLLVALIYLIYKLIFWDSEIGIAPIIIGLFTLGFQIFILIYRRICNEYFNTL